MHKKYSKMSLKELKELHFKYLSEYLELTYQFDIVAERLNIMSQFPFKRSTEYWKLKRKRMGYNSKCENIEIAIGEKRSRKCPAFVIKKNGSSLCLISEIHSVLKSIMFRLECCPCQRSPEKARLLMISKHLSKKE